MFTTKALGVRQMMSKISKQAVELSPPPVMKGAKLLAAFTKRFFQ
jgi:hypothetical protein